MSRYEAQLKRDCEQIASLQRQLAESTRQKVTMRSALKVSKEYIQSTSIIHRGQGSDDCRACSTLRTIDAALRAAESTGAQG